MFIRYVGLHQIITNLTFPDHFVFNIGRQTKYVPEWLSQTPPDVSEVTSPHTASKILGKT